MTIETDTFHFSPSFPTARPLLPPRDGESEFAAFTAQFAHRAERLRQARTSEPSRHTLEPVTDIETGHTAELRAGALLLVGLAATVLVVWAWSIQPTTAVPVRAADTATTEAPATPSPAPGSTTSVEQSPSIDVPVPEPAPAPQILQAASSPATVLPASAKAVASSLVAASRSAPAAAPPTTVTRPIAAATAPATTAPAIASVKAAVSTPLNSSEARELQGRLRATGFDPGPIDGIVGPLTTDAARRYGAARALTGQEPGRNMLVRLRSEPTQSADLPPQR
jgi:hypothetical protein